MQQALNLDQPSNTVMKKSQIFPNSEMLRGSYSLFGQNVFTSHRFAIVWDFAAVVLALAIVGLDEIFY